MVEYVYLVSEFLDQVAIRRYEIFSVSKKMVVVWDGTVKKKLKIDTLDDKIFFTSSEAKDYALEVVHKLQAKLEKKLAELNEFEHEPNCFIIERLEPLPPGTKLEF